MRVLDAFRVPSTSIVASLSEQVASLLVKDLGRSTRVCASGRLDGARVVVPLHHCGLRLRHATEPDVRLSLACLLATFRAGGVVAPVAPCLLRPPKDLNGFVPSESNTVTELPAILTQWRPGVVLSFGDFSEVFARMTRPKSWWVGGVDTMHLAMRRINFYPEASMAAEHDLDLNAVAVELPGGQRLTYRTLLSAIYESEPLGTPTVESILVGLLRAAAAGDGGRAAATQVHGEPWWVRCQGIQTATTWPPKRLPRRRNSCWTPVQDPVSHYTYYWNQATDETAWEPPPGGRRSDPRGAKAAPKAKQRAPSRVAFGPRRAGASTKPASEELEFACAGRRSAERRVTPQPGPVYYQVVAVRPPTPTTKLKARSLADEAAQEEYPLGRGPVEIVEDDSRHGDPRALRGLWNVGA